MPRKITIINSLIDSKQQEQLSDREQLAKLKTQAQSGGAPSELLQKQINALRQTLANGAEDLDDLKLELAQATEYEVSVEGVRKRAEAGVKLKVADAMSSVCVSTAAAADQALNAAWTALRRHHDAHQALREAVGGAYAAVTEGGGADPYGDQSFLLWSYSNLSNSGAALAEWVIESLRGYGLEHFIKVEGITLHHNKHETLLDIDGLMLNRMVQRLKEIAVKCGHEVHGPNDAGLEPLRQALLQSVLSAPIQ